jgi:hypothetical protein
MFLVSIILKETHLLWTRLELIIAEMADVMTPKALAFFGLHSIILVFHTSPPILYAHHKLTHVTAYGGGRHTLASGLNA